MAKATAIFDGDDSRLNQVVQRIDKKLRDLQGRFANVMGFATKVLAAPAVAAAGLAVGIGNMMDEAGRLNDLSANTGIAVGELQILGQEFKNAGKSAEDVGPSVAKMQKFLTSDEAGKKVRELGLDLAALQGMTPSEQFRAFGKAINGIEDPAARATAAMEVFGKSGATMLSMFAAGGFGEAATQVGTQAEILNRDAALFDAVGDKLATAGLRVQGFFVGVADKVVPVIAPLLDRFNDLDLAGMGQQVGEFIAFLIQSFSDGSIWGILAESGKIAMMNVANFLAGAVMAVGKGLWQYIVESFKNGIAVLGILTTADFWKGLGNALLAAAQNFTASMLEGVSKLLAYLAKVPGLGKIAGAASATGDTAAGLRAAAAANNAQAAEQWAPAMAVISNRMAETLANVGKAMSDGFKSGSGVFDTSSAQNALAAKVDAVMSAVEKTTAAQLAANPTNASTRGVAAAEQIGNAAVSTLQKVGLDAYGGGYDPQLEEARAQTGVMRNVEKRLQEVRKDLQPLARITSLPGRFA